MRWRLREGLRFGTPIVLVRLQFQFFQSSPGRRGSDFRRRSPETRIAGRCFHREPATLRSAQRFRRQGEEGVFPDERRQVGKITILWNGLLSREGNEGGKIINIEPRLKGREAPGAAAFQHDRQGSLDEDVRTLPGHFEVVPKRLCEPDNFIVEICGELHHGEFAHEFLRSPFEQSEINLERHGSGKGCVRVSALALVEAY